MTLGEVIPWQKNKRGLSTLREENPFHAMQSKMNYMLEDLFNGFGTEPFDAITPVFGSYTPRIDVVDSEKEIVVTAELPGMEKGDFDLTLTKDALTIKGEKKQAREESPEKGRYHYERSYGAFQRTVPLTVEVNENAIDASFKNGVLKIVLPKTAEAQRQCKKISIRS